MSVTLATDAHVLAGNQDRPLQVYERNWRLVEYFAVQVRTGQIRTVQARAVQVRTAQIRTVQVRTAQIRTVQVRTAQIRTVQARAGQVRAGQVRAGQVRAAQVRAGQARAGQVRTAQIRCWILVRWSGTSPLRLGSVRCSGLATPGDLFRRYWSAASWCVAMG
jgi:hypothetical protein